MKRILLPLILSTMAIPLMAQNVLEQYIEAGLANNLSLKQENFDLLKSIEALKESKGLFLPQLSFSASYNLARGGRTIDVPVGDLLNPVYGTLNQLTDSQNFPTALENASEPILPNRFHDTRIELRQPLFNTDIYYNYKAKSSLVSVQQAHREAYKQELVKEIRKGYYEYLKSLELLAIYDSSETVLIELVEVNRSLVRNHKATKDAIYNAEFELSDLNGQIAEAERNRHLAKSYFNFLLNRDLEDTILVDPAIEFYYGQIGKVEDLQDQAVMGREELLQVRKAKEANEYLLKLNQGTKLPKFSVGGISGFQGFDYKFDGDQDYSLLQFNLEIPLFTGFQNNAKIQQARINVDKIQTQQQALEKQIRVQVIEGYRNLQAARKVVLSREQGAKSAAESFRIIRRKYEENQVILVEYLDARTKFTNSQIALAIANYDLLIREAELQRILSL